MSKFGWSMPAGAWESILPGEEQENPIALKCSKCGRFIPMKVVRVEPWEDPPHAMGVTEYYNCSRCGETCNPVPVFA